MTDRPIICSAGQVKAILDGDMTMTRRLAWKHHPFDGDNRILSGGIVPAGYQWRHGDLVKPTIWQAIRPGDQLWVRETFWGCDFAETGDRPIVVYEERHHGKSYDHPGNVMIVVPHFGHIPSIHMPRRASRLTLVVTATWIERVQDISYSDVVAEGLAFSQDRLTSVEVAAALDTWRRTWERLHGTASWNANPEVVVLSFETHRRNIAFMDVAA